MDDFYSQPSSMIALAKALFGDFPFEEIMDNSRGYLNAMMFIMYLFVAVFILLSMFLAILGEAQAAAREDEEKKKASGEYGNEYGAIGESFEWVKQKVHRLRSKGNGGDDEDEDGAGAARSSEEEESEEEEDGRPQVDMALSTALTKLQT